MHSLLLEFLSRTEKGLKDSECPLKAGRVSETPALLVSCRSQDEKVACVAGAPPVSTLHPVSRGLGTQLSRPVAAALPSVAADSSAHL